MKMWQSSLNESHLFYLSQEVRQRIISSDLVLYVDLRAALDSSCDSDLLTVIYAQTKFESCRKLCKITVTRVHYDAHRHCDRSGIFYRDSDGPFAISTPFFPDFLPVCREEIERNGTKGKQDAVGYC